MNLTRGLNELKGAARTQFLMVSAGLVVWSAMAAGGESNGSRVKKLSKKQAKYQRDTYGKGAEGRRRKVKGKGPK
jgi:hypothetical protein